MANRFQVGDRIRRTGVGSGGIWAGVEGTVVYAQGGEIRVVFDDMRWPGESVWFDFVEALDIRFELVEETTWDELELQ